MDEARKNRLVRFWLDMGFEVEREDGDVLHMRRGPGETLTVNWRALASLASAERDDEPTP